MKKADLRVRCTYVRECVRLFSRGCGCLYVRVCVCVCVCECVCVRERKWKVMGQRVKAHP